MSANPAIPPPSFIRPPETPIQTAVGEAINAAYLADETQCVRALIELARPQPAMALEIRSLASQLVESVRKNRTRKGGIEAFLQQYDLASREGVILMCLAEALLRIPDSDTADRLISDKISTGDWSAHLGESDSLFVNASTWGLMLTGKIVSVDSDTNAKDFLSRLVARVGEPVVRAALRQAMRIMGHQFVMGRTIDEALKRARDGENKKFRYSFDMLGEAAMTAEDAERYFNAYSEAIARIGAARVPGTSDEGANSISVKLSALFPRYTYAQRERVLKELAPRVLELCAQARAQNIALTIDAEEADRLEISLEIIERIIASPVTDGWNGFGLAVQAYQKRAPAVLRFLIDRAKAGKRRINIRLVKGAYWDSEIKRAQEQGLSGYPVFTRKPNTDVSYLACARIMLDTGDELHPQFATHNAHTVASIICMAAVRGKAFEFQRLHGMGEELYEEITGAPVEDDKRQTLRRFPCRVYAPVGAHEDLLPYLVRRLLENGANTSFVHRIVDERQPIDDIVADPIKQVEAFQSISHPRIPLPSGLYGAERINSQGINLADGNELTRLARESRSAIDTYWQAGPIVNGKTLQGPERQVVNPANRNEAIGTIASADDQAVDAAMTAAAGAHPAWNALGGEGRAVILERAADVFEKHRGELIALVVREGGRTIPDAVSELREAVDFLRYYAAGARRDFHRADPLPGPTGESNELRLEGRGVFACISPWNFPLAIFTGQVSAALASGNTVLCKPAEQTTLIAARAVSLLHQAGVPVEALHYVPGPGSKIGARMTADPRLAGVVFTGSTETARRINRSLAARDSGPLAVVIAETGGQNAMLVDSSALPEQVVADVVQSSFNSAGQRCSALRVLFLQEEIADRTLRLLSGYMDELTIGDPALLSTDVGPVIDEPSRRQLEEHAQAIVKGARWSHRCKLDSSHARGTFLAPLAVEIDSISRLENEVFGPILHVVRYSSRSLDKVVEAINSTGFGLTCGIHSRIDSHARNVSRRLRVGNVYVNRNMIGAVVGVQPFGGQGLSGTGPKAGGPHYLHRMATEQTLTINTAAVGGNATLLSLSADDTAR